MRQFLALCWCLALAGCGGSGDSDAPPDYQVGFSNDSRYCLFVEYRPQTAKGTAPWLPWGDWSIAAGETQWLELPRGAYEYRRSFVPTNNGAGTRFILDGDPTVPVLFEPRIGGSDTRLTDPFTLQVGNRTRKRIVALVQILDGRTYHEIPVSCAPLEHLEEAEVQLEAGSYWIRWATRGDSGWDWSSEVPITGEPGEVVRWVWS